MSTENHHASAIKNYGGFTPNKETKENIHAAHFCNEISMCTKRIETRLSVT